MCVSSLYCYSVQFQVLRDQESAEGKNVSLKDNVTEEELEAALAATSQEEQDQEQEGPLRRRNRRFGPRRRSRMERGHHQVIRGEGRTVTVDEG